MVHYRLTFMEPSSDYRFWFSASKTSVRVVNHSVRSFLTRQFMNAVVTVVRYSLRAVSGIAMWQVVSCCKRSQDLWGHVALQEEVERVVTSKGVWWLVFCYQAVSCSAKQIFFLGKVMSLHEGNASYRFCYAHPHTVVWVSMKEMLTTDSAMLILTQLYESPWRKCWLQILHCSSSHNPTAQTTVPSFSDLLRSCPS